MIDIAWSEFIFIALLALILIGPKELPTVLRTIGRWAGKARALSKSFTDQLDLETHLNELPLEKPEATKVSQNNTSSTPKPVEKSIP